MRNKVMILGAAGFIGTNLTLRLLEEQKELILFDREEAVFAPKVQQAVRRGSACLIKGSFTDNTWTEKLSLLQDVEVAYHLVSTTYPANSNQNVAVEIEENLVSTIYFLDACVAAGIPKIVFLSSGGTVYGKEHTGIHREEEEAFPITVYGVQKLGIEKMLYLYNHMYGLDYRIVRLSNPYGPYQRPNGIQGVVTTFTWRALHDLPIEIYGDGSIVRDYIYIDDAVDGILKISGQSGNHRLYNLGSGIGLSVSEVVKKVENALGKKAQVTFSTGRNVDVPVNILDISRFKQDFGGFTPIGLSEGISRLVRFFEQEET